MDGSILIGAMAFTTLLGVAAFAFISKRKVDERRQDENRTKSTLAKDKDSKGRPADV
jgi:hypothetical protein